MADTDAPNPSAAKTEPDDDMSDASMVALILRDTLRIGRGTTDGDPVTFIEGIQEAADYISARVVTHPQPSLSVGLDREAVKSAIRSHVHGNVINFEGRSLPGLGISGVDKAAATILALAAPAEGWQPIETAPRDATEVLVLLAPKVIRLGWYFKRSSRTEGWCDENGKSIKPTHWMPLPAAPTGGLK